MSVNLIYMTADSREAAEAIGRELVGAKLAACVNIIAGMNSIYRWQNELQMDKEVVIIAKTTSSKAEALIERVKSIHSYDCPCILQLPVSGGHQPFLDWITAEVKDL
jgi:periplasmic divalent cation tolerance protein